MKRIAFYVIISVLLAACSSKEETPPAAPSELEQQMTALYGENKVIDGEYPDSLAVEAANGTFVGERDQKQ